MQDCDWTLTGKAADRPGETKRELREELARKLKQFDDCMAQAGVGDAAGAGDSGEGVDGKGQEVAAPPASSPGEPASSPGASQPAAVAAQPASLPEEPGPPFDPASPLPPADPPGSADPPPEVVSAGRPQGAGENPQLALVEDDLARLIREAAEKETDPVRRAALWEQYNSYVKTL